MGLPRALKAHGAGSLEEAELHYRRAYEQGQKTDILYQLHVGMQLLNFDDHQKLKLALTM